jgi:hypothetical protein
MPLILANGLNQHYELTGPAGAPLVVFFPFGRRLARNVGPADRRLHRPLPLPAL